MARIWKKEIAIIKVSVLNKVEKIIVIHGKFKIYWKSLLILLMQRDLQRQKFAKAETRPRDGIWDALNYSVRGSALRRIKLSKFGELRLFEATRIKIHDRHGWQREIGMIRFKRVKRNALCSPARGALGKNPFGRYLRFNHIPQPFASHSERYITFINEVE